MLVGDGRWMGGIKEIDGVKTLGKNFSCEALLLVRVFICVLCRDKEKEE